jgi:LDH2 family malate/lactate/ureidoglycolate dehydrogenase
MGQPIAQETTTVDVEELARFCIAAMAAAGLSEEDARLSAEVLVTTDTWGTFTHGTRQLRGLLKNFRVGRLHADAQMQVEAEGPGWARVDGQDAMPLATAYRSMELCIAKARATGIGYVGVRRSSHYGAAGFYAVMAAQQGMIGLSMCNVDPGVTAPGSRGRVMGTNPIAYAAPRRDGPPVFLDIATSAVAASKLYAAQALNQPIPDTWLVDDDGLPTTDPTGYPRRGALQPMAGHKGYGLAVLVEILTAVLTGAGIMGEVNSWMLDSLEPANQGHAFIAIDVAAMMPPAMFAARMEQMADEIHSAPLAVGAERIYLPGEKEWEHRAAALAHGIPLPPFIIANLRGVAEDTGVTAAWL